MADESTAEPVLPTVTQDASKIPIESIDEDFLVKLNNTDLGELQHYVHVCGQILRHKAVLIHKVVEFRTKCMDKARKYIKLSGPEIDALLGACPEEEAAEIRKAILVLVNGPAQPEAPPTQHLEGSFITRDAADVLPGGSTQTPAAQA
jgi:hypothetical protein